MYYELNGKKIRIPDATIAKNVQILGISELDAITMWLEDEGYFDNPEQTALEEKGKEVKATKFVKAQGEKPKTQRERVKKENPTKTMVIKAIAEMLPQFAESVEIVNDTKLITFTIGDKNFKIDLTEQRKPKNPV